jgi:ubiquinone/menaquinone biosynthesis C-methylase UbiE
MSGLREHWEGVYSTKAEDQVSWFQEEPRLSMDLIERAGLGRGGAILDVGGGASRLVDELLARGHTDLTVLDLSAEALEVARRRLGERADLVAWIVADATAAPLAAHRYDLWHDRAAFHFLTDPEQRRRYIDLARRSVRPGGHVIVATFGPDGPNRCSNLPVMRYTPQSLHAEFGPAFKLVEHREEAHRTPWGAAQAFVYCLFEVAS